MIEEPYRWVEAIANRREYIEHQLAAGSPIVALSCQEGVLFFTLSRERQKLFEIYDRIGMGGIGHPGDLERLRLAAIELCSTEGFARSAQDVSLRRLANYSLSPALKTAFEQVYGAPYLSRLLFAEVSRGEGPDLFLRLDYDGSMRTNGGTFGRATEEFGVLAGSSAAAERMERHLRALARTRAPFASTVRLAAAAWSLGHMGLPDDDASTPSAEQIEEHLASYLAAGAVECALLERNAPTAATWRMMPEGEVRELLG